MVVVVVVVVVVIVIVVVIVVVVVVVVVGELSTGRCHNYYVLCVVRACVYGGGEVY